MMFIKKVFLSTFCFTVLNGTTFYFKNTNSLIHAALIETNVLKTNTFTTAKYIKSSNYIGYSLPSTKVISSVINRKIINFQGVVSINRELRASAQSLKLVASNELGSDETIIRFGTGATRGFDSQWDIYKLGSNNLVPTLSSVTDGAGYAINSLPVIEEGTTVDVNLELPSEGNCTLLIKDLMNFENYTAINLYDKVTHTTQNLLLNHSYNFTSTKDAIKQRFVLTFQQAAITQTMESSFNSKLSISSNSKHVITIKALHTFTGKADVEVTNLVGEVVFKLFSIDLANGLADIKIEDATSAIYIVNAIIDGRSYSQKIYLE